LCAGIEGQSLYKSWLGKSSVNIARLIEAIQSGDPAGLIGIKETVYDLVADPALLLAIEEDNKASNLAEKPFRDIEDILRDNSPGSSPGKPPEGFVPAPEGFTGWLGAYRYQSRAPDPRSPFGESIMGHTYAEKKDPLDIEGAWKIL
jgi:hypothetical protein